MEIIEDMVHWISPPPERRLDRCLRLRDTVIVASQDKPSVSPMFLAMLMMTWHPRLGYCSAGSFFVSTAHLERGLLSILKGLVARMICWDNYTRDHPDNRDP